MPRAAVPAPSSEFPFSYCTQRAGRAAIRGRSAHEDPPAADTGEHRVFGLSLQPAELDHGQLHVTAPARPGGERGRAPADQLLTGAQSLVLGRVRWIGLNKKPERSAPPAAISPADSAPRHPARSLGPSITKPWGSLQARLPITPSSASSTADWSLAHDGCRGSIAEAATARVVARIFSSTRGSPTPCATTGRAATFRSCSGRPSLASAVRSRSSPGTQGISPATEVIR